MPLDNDNTDLDVLQKMPSVKAGPGAQKAAAVILALGPELAGTIFRHFTDQDMRFLAAGAKSLKDAPSNFVTTALREFFDSMHGHGTELVAGDDILKDMLHKALGVDAAERAFAEQKPKPPTYEILGPLAEAEPDDLALLLAKEHPQTTALILSAMDPKAASEVLTELPEHTRAQILQRVARVEAVSPEILEGVVQVLLDELEAMGSGIGRRRLNGRDAAIELLRRIPATEQGENLSEIEEEDPELAEELRKNLFTFDDLAGLMDRDIQALLKEVDVAQLTVALKSASEKVKEKVIANMSRRVAQMLLDDLATMPPVRLAEVQQAQEDISRVAMQLASDGRITIVTGEEELL